MFKAFECCRKIVNIFLFSINSDNENFSEGKLKLNAILIVINKNPLSYLGCHEGERVHAAKQADEN